MYAFSPTSPRSDLLTGFKDIYKTSSVTPVGLPPHPPFLENYEKRKKKKEKKVLS